MTQLVRRVWSHLTGLSSQVTPVSPVAPDQPPSPGAPEELAQYNTADARTLFSDLLRRVRCGEQIVIAHAGMPVAKLVPYGGDHPTRPGVIRAHLVIDEHVPREPVVGAARRASSRQER